MLAGRGLTWRSAERGLLGATWTDLSAPGLTASSLSLTLLPTPAAVLTDGLIQLDAITLPSGSAGSTSPSPPPLPVLLSAEGITVRWKESVLATQLSGTLLPTLALSGPGAWLARSESGWSGELTRPIDVTPLSGEVTLTVTGPDPIAINLSMPEAIIDHPLLANRALPPAVIRAEAIWQEGRIDGTVQLADIPVSISGALSPENIALELSAEAAPLASILSFFGQRLVPELKRTEVRGSFSFAGKLTGPPLAWQATVAADGLAAAGVLHDAEAMRYGNFTWRAPGPEGGFVMRETGDEHPSWTDIEPARLVGDAAIASEDARFAAHDGFDIEGINVALTELSSGVERPRGGSTITQQLAKNLFLSGDRTIARKLRELLYALEMERTLGKMRILELYLNVVEFGPEIYGVRQAADHYFLKRPENLAPHEAAFLTAILPSPRSWHARILAGRRGPEATIDRILGNMINTGALEEGVARWAQAEPLIIVPPQP